jgi:hypothetical protein
VATAVIGLGNVASGKSVTFAQPITVLGLPAGYNTKPVAVTGLHPSLVYVPVKLASEVVTPATVVVQASHIIGAVAEVHALFSSNDSIIF